MNSDRMFTLMTPVLRPLADRKRAAARRYFDQVPVPPKRVLFLGDSIIAAGLWADFFPELPTTNRGIGGDTTYDVAERLDGVLNDPLAVLLLIGSNDLYQVKQPADSAALVARTEDIITRIRAAAPDALLLVNSIFPRTELFAPRIRTVNAGYEEAARRHGATYVDLWPTFADDAGHIKPELTRDNLHLTPRGYLAWCEVLRPLLAPYAIHERA